MSKNTNKYGKVSRGVLAEISREASAILHNLARTYKQRKRQINRDTSADTAGSEEESSRETSADFYLRSQHDCISRKALSDI